MIWVLIRSLTFFLAYKLREIQKLPKMKKRVIFIFFYGKIETEIESGLLQQTINTLNKLIITFLRSFEQKKFYCQKVLPLLSSGNISYFGHKSSQKKARNFWYSPLFMIFNSPSNHHNFKINQAYRLFWVKLKDKCFLLSKTFSLQQIEID